MRLFLPILFPLIVSTIKAVPLMDTLPDGLLTDFIEQALLKDTVNPVLQQVLPGATVFKIAGQTIDLTQATQRDDIVFAGCQRSNRSGTATRCLCSPGSRESTHDDSSRQCRDVYQGLHGEKVWFCG